MNEAYYKSLEPFFGSWYIKEYIGRGSYGQVYRIEKEDISGSYSSAMKIISIGGENDAVGFSGGMTQENLDEYYGDLIRNIIREFKMMEKLKGNTNIVCYEDHEIRKRNDGAGYDIFIRMEQLVPINKHFGTTFPGEDEVIKLGIDMCRALELCHKNNIIHRDVKPQNIFVSPTGDYKLGDFGVARNFENTVGEFSAKGTFDYMAPEVQLRQPYGVTADIFSLGAVLYKLMNNGRIAFLPDYPETVRSSDYEIALEKRLNGETPKRPVLAGNPFSNIIIKACMSDPSQRYDSAEKMRADLERVLRMKNGQVQYSDYALGKNGEGFIFKGTAILEKAPKTPPQTPQKMQDIGESYETHLFPAQKDEQKTKELPKVHDHETQAQKTPPIEKLPDAPPSEKVLQEEVEKVREIIAQKAEDSVLSVTGPTEESNLKIVPEKTDTKTITTKAKERKSEKKMNGKKQKLFIGITIAVIVLVILIIIAGIGVVVATNPALHDKLQSVLPFDISFLKPDTSAKAPSRGEETELSEEWQIESYEEKYPFYAIERLYLDGEATDEYRVSETVTKYTEDEARIFYSINLDTGVATRTLYLNGAPTDYVETVTAMADTEWVIEGYETDSFREYARKYVNGAMTDETCYTGRTFESAYFVSIEGDAMTKLLYVDGKPVSSSEITELVGEVWVLEGFEVDTYRQYARKYVDGNPTDETKLTGLVYKAEDYYCFDGETEMYYLITYVNGIPMNDTKRGYIASIAGIADAWVISEYYEAATYNEYAERHLYGVNTGEVRYTGAKKQIIEWIIEGYSNIAPYYQYARKYVNGEKTYETRYTTPYKTDPARAPKPVTPTPSKPVEVQPEPVTPTTPVVPEPDPVPELKYYMNPDGSINFSKLQVEYWYDEMDREYKVWYDKDGNEVIRFATGAYKVRRNK